MLMFLLTGWLVNAIALGITASLLPGIEVDGPVTLIVAAAVVGLVNAWIRPVVQLIALPISILTLGIFALVVNAAMIGFAAWLVSGLTIDGFWPAFWGAIILALVSTVLSQLIRPEFFLRSRKA